MKQQRDRRTRVAPYTIGKPNIYGPVNTDFSSQTEISNKENIPPPEIPTVSPLPNENSVSQDPTSVAPSLCQTHSLESCILCFLQFFFFFSKFFSVELTKTKYFYFLAFSVYQETFKIRQNCPASQAVSLSDIISELDNDG